MKTLLVGSIRLRFFLLALLAVIACDSFEPEEEDQVKFSQTDFYVLPGASSVIDLPSLVEHTSGGVTYITCLDYKSKPGSG